MVRTPVRTHAMSIQPGLLMSRDMSADTIKMPDPIMVAITVMVESNRLRPRTNSCGGFWADAVDWLIEIPECNAGSLAHRAARRQGHGRYPTTISNLDSDPVRMMTVSLCGPARVAGRPLTRTGPVAPR